MEPRLMDIDGYVGVATEVHFNTAGSVDYVVEQPPAVGFRETIWIFDDDDPPIFSVQAGDLEEEDQEEEDLEGEDPEEEYFRAEFFEEEYFRAEFLEREDFDAVFKIEWSDGYVSEDSGYDSLDEDEEDLEDGEEEDVQPRFRLVQVLPPPAGAPVVVGPAAPPQEDPAVHIVSFPKRPREESDVETQAGTKRQRTSEEEDGEQPGSSTSGVASSTDHSTSGPSTSRPSFSVTSGNWFRPFWNPDDIDSD